MITFKMSGLCKAVTKKGTSCPFKSQKGSLYCGKHQLSEIKLNNLSKKLETQCTLSKESNLFKSKYQIKEYNSNSKPCVTCSLPIIKSCPKCLGELDYPILNIVHIINHYHKNAIFDYKYVIKHQNKLFCYRLIVIIDSVQYLIEFDGIEKCIEGFEFLENERSYEEHQKIITQKCLLSMMQGYKMIRIPYHIDFRLEIELMKGIRELEDKKTSDIYFMDTKIYKKVINKLNLFMND